MARYVLEVMYDGTQFHGSQIQGDTPTVQLYINKALSIILRMVTESFGASRTDEGVHAISNYYHFDTEKELQHDFLYKLNSIIPFGMAIKRVCKATNPDFNARFDAISRKYKYRLYSKKNPFMQHRALYYPFSLKTDLLDQSAAIVLANNNFESFSKRNTQSKTFICNINESYWLKTDDELNYIVEGNRFLRGMVRGLVGTQLQVARQRITLADFKNIFESKDCTKAFFNVDGHGLYLENITYLDDALVTL